MKLLLDTHVIIWALTDDRRLDDNIRSMIKDPDNIIYYSIASVWEIALKNYKSPDKCPYEESNIAELCRASGYELLEIKIDHICGVRKLHIKDDQHLLNYDPFDRLLISQAKSEGMRVISHDANFENYDEECILKF